VEEAESPLALYLERRAALEASPESGAGDWLELARWARTNDLPRQSRQAALVAAALDPQVPGLPPLMRGLGYALDPELGSWVPYAEHMRRRGFVNVGGVWIERAEHEARLEAERRQRDEARRQALLEAEERARIQRQLEEVRQQERLAAAQAAQAAAPRFAPGQVAVPFFYAAPASFFVVHGGLFAGGGQAPPTAPRQSAAEVSQRGVVLDAVARQPGSLIPGRLDLSPPRSPRP
jgi:hypothetical protein